MDFFVTPPSTTTRTQTSLIQAPLSPRYTFDQFVIGKSNELAAAAAHAVTQASARYTIHFLYMETLA